jgi:hypothetical protein
VPEHFQIRLFKAISSGIFIFLREKKREKKHKINVYFAKNITFKNASVFKQLQIACNNFNTLSKNAYRLKKKTKKKKQKEAK